MDNGLGGLRSGEAIRIATESAKVEGIMEALESDTLYVRTASPTTIGIPTSSIRTAWVQRGSVARATKIGAATGAIVIGVGAAVATYIECEHLDDGCIIGPRVVGTGGAIIGALGGALIGRFAGFARRPWVKIFP